MKTISKLIIGLVLMTAISVHAMAQETLPEMIERGLSVSRSQSKIMAKSLENNKEAFPKTFEKGKLVTCDYRWWVSGFFPGVLWQLYSDNGDNELRRYAELYTNRAEPVKKMTDTHDLGFMLYCSFGWGYHLTGNPHYLEVIKEGSDNLIARFDPRVGVIKSWESGPKWKYPVIIDNMMNLEMLTFLTRETNDSKYLNIALSHADTTIKNHFRDNFTTFHVVSYDPETGKPHAKNTAQGYADNSSWARGQGWALYGYTMMYRETMQPRYLLQAQRVANMIMTHPRLPEDGIPYWDFDAPNIPKALRDASAGAVMASAFIELSQLDPTDNSKKWYDMGVKQLRSLSSPAYLAEPGEIGGFILKHSVGALPAKSEVDVPLTYADYYYVEALLRLKKLLAKPCGSSDRTSWINALEKISMPVLENLANNTLKKNMPFESLSSDPDRKAVSYLEAVGRTICGVAPWLELGNDGTEEGARREKMIQLTIKGLANAVDPNSPDYLLFHNKNNRHAQPLVDAAFLAEGLLRAPNQIWNRLDKTTQQRLISELKASRAIKPYECNWLLFASIVECALLKFDGECDMERLMYGVEKFRNEWYKGDGWYGDGPAFHNDYYNSLVIHPMLTETLLVIKKHNLKNADFLAEQQMRHGRYAEQLERMISPEGTYPITGRSITYRFGSFHALSDAALLRILPGNLNPAQVRCALTAVINRQLSMKNTFDSNGWLRIGITGSQIHASEDYINTGSEYLCCAVFCALGLPASDPFWASPAADWTCKKVWNNIDIPADHAIR